MCHGQNQNESESNLGAIPHLSLTFTNGCPHSVIGALLIRSQSPDPAYKWSESTAVSLEGFEI